MKEIGNDFGSESHGCITRIEENTNDIDSGFGRKRGREREGRVKRRRTNSEEATNEASVEVLVEKLKDM